MDAIPRETDMQLYAQIRKENRGKWHRFTHLQCWGCMINAEGNPDKMCLSSPEGYSGCNLVNKRYARRGIYEIR